MKACELLSQMSPQVKTFKLSAARKLLRPNVARRQHSVLCMAFLRFWKRHDGPIIARGLGKCPRQDTKHPQLIYEAS